jgi:hypothetical protein
MSRDKGNGKGQGKGKKPDRNIGDFVIPEEGDTDWAGCVTKSMEVTSRFFQGNDRGTIFGAKDCRINLELRQVEELDHNNGEWVKLFSFTNEITTAQPRAILHDVDPIGWDTDIGQRVYCDITLENEECIRNIMIRFQVTRQTGATCTIQFDHKAQRPYFIWPWEKLNFEKGQKYTFNLTWQNDFGAHYTGFERVVKEIH